MARATARSRKGPIENDLAAVHRSAIAGAGVFATADIPPRHVLEDVTRPFVSYAQVPQKGEPGYGHAVQVRRGRWLLLDHSVFYYLNHSCEPNTRLEIRGASVKVITSKKVRRGQELTLDYATLVFRDDPYEFRCTCASQRCRGLVKGTRR